MWRHMYTPKFCQNFGAIYKQDTQIIEDKDSQDKMWTGQSNCLSRKRISNTLMSFDRICCVQDLNINPKFPYEDNSFDIITDVAVDISPNPGRSDPIYIVYSKKLATA
ncbi:uncharacterized protein LOC130756629 isoform X2 [Actinidia eriantha]|uniref:uncharacterized protein LOC130756629 isoform X2 n=1 Tax=Actinidia eriantha TaxID=165200 RepID=UPI00258AC2F8|nr:uncharacterized protein LOC130756629 isoform X2 [Actinidia eriantha]